MEIKNKQKLSNFECGWWDTKNDRLATDDCELVPTNVDDDGVLVCRCPHLTDFMSIYSEETAKRFTDANWQ